LRRSLENSDHLVAKKNQEISELNSRLAAANQKLEQEIEERDAEIERVTSEFERRSETKSENSASAGVDLSKFEAADLFNQLKGRRKKSRAELADMRLILEIMEES
jgi:hypothetical protein